MEEKKSRLYLKILANHLVFIAIALLCIFVIPKVLVFFWPFIVGWIIALIANPLVRLLEKKVKIVRKHGTAIVIVLVLAAVISLMYLILYMLIKQGIEFVGDFPKLYEQAAASVQEFINSLSGKLPFWSEKSNGITETIGSSIDKFIDGIIKRFSESSEMINSASNIVKSVVDGLILTVITILASYFLTSEHDNIVKRAKNMIPLSIKNGYKFVMGQVMSALIGYFKAQFKIMCCAFVILSIGLLLLGVDYAILFALIIAVVDFLPVLGAGAIIWPWCAYELIVGNYLNAVVLLILYVLCQALRQFLQPKMVADSVGLTPLETIFYMFVGYRIWGIIGMIIGIPIGMIISSLYKSGVFNGLIEGAKIMAGDFNEWRKFEKKG